MIGFTLPEQIPPITHKFGRYWDQPKLSDVVLERGVAFMSLATFEALCEYSTSIPTGVYEGKMWKRERLVPRDAQLGAFNRTGEWSLCWFDTAPDPDRCRIRTRPIRVLAL
jgi:hypothetical protein